MAQSAWWWRRYADNFTNWRTLVCSRIKYEFATFEPSTFECIVTVIGNAKHEHIVFERASIDKPEQQFAASNSRFI
jgi:hypothetical protein